MIPGVGEAIDAGMIAAIQAAKLSEYAFGAGEEGLNAYTSWMNPCGTSNLPKNVRKAFDIFNDVSGDIIPGGFKVPKGVKPADKPRPTPRTTPRASTPRATKQSTPRSTSEPTSAPTSEPTPGRSASNSKHSSSSSKSSDVCLIARAGPAGAAAAGAGMVGAAAAAAAAKCDVHETTITGSKLKSYSTITKTCSANIWSQACFHYYSVLKNYEGTSHISSIYTCSDSQVNRRDDFKQDKPATDLWSTQHDRNWWTWTTESKFTIKQKRGEKIITKTGDPRCQRDEYPPAFWLPLDKASNKGWAQLVRYLPGSENGGAGSLWNGICRDHDGGAGNGQFYGDKPPKGKKPGEVNTSLLDLKNPQETSHVGKDKKTTTVTKFEAHYQRAVWEVKFEWEQGKIPSSHNSWFLAENPCWPQAIAPNDPGFVLLTNDKWYNTGKYLPDRTKEYAEPPTDQHTSDAIENLKKWHKMGYKRDTSGLLLENIGDGLVIREANLSRKLTKEEVQNNLEVIDCKDRTCSEERAQLDAEHDTGYLVLPPTSLPDTPAANEASERTQVVENVTPATLRASPVHLSITSSIIQTVS